MYKYLTCTLLSLVLAAPIAAEPMTQNDLNHSYRRVLPLEGGSNFRDMGGYKTQDGKTIVRGMLFRSGSMASLTQADQEYLDSFGFKTIVDLRSKEEIELAPNYWAAASKLDYRTVDYSMMAMMEGLSKEELKAMSDYSKSYPGILNTIKPQIKLYFDALIEGQAPIAMNCSAGQDRTGMLSAVVLTALGVDRDIVIEDYLLSTDFRRPSVEYGHADLKEAAKTNAFARMMLEYAKKMPNPGKPNPLVTEDGVPFLLFALNHVEAKYGSVTNWLDQEIGVSAQELETIKSLYLH